MGMVKPCVEKGLRFDDVDCVGVAECVVWLCLQMHALD